MSAKNQIVLTAEDGSEEVFFVMGQAQIAGENYLLVANKENEEDSEEVDALVLKEIEDGDEIVYDVLDDEKEIKIISKYFEEIIDDIELKME